jgi:FAD:protein FMN transferase
LLCFLALIGVRSEAQTGSDNETQSAWRRYESSYPVMGTEFKATFYSKDQDQAESAIVAAWKRVEEINSALSDYIPESELNRLSRSSGSSQWIPLGDDLKAVLDRSDQISTQSSGAFDVTVGPLTKIWRRASRRDQIPDQDSIDAALGSVGFYKIKWNEERDAVLLEAQEMRLDLGGIAKGFAAEEALMVLKKHGISRAIIDAGGDLVAGAPPPGELGWEVGLLSYSKQARIPASRLPSGENSGNKELPPARQSIRIAHGAVASSGDLFQFFEVDGVRYSHILDPRSGMALTDEGRVNLIACSGMDADALASALSVMEPEEGLKMLKQFPGAEAQIIRNTDQGIRVWRSKGFSDFVMAE